MASMSVESDPYQDMVTLVGNPAHFRIIRYVRENPGVYVSDIIEGTGMPRGTLGRILRILVDIDVLTVDVPPEKRTSGRIFRYAVNETRVQDLLAVLHTEILGPQAP